MAKVSAAVGAVFSVLSLSASALAVDNPFTEPFSSAACNWSTSSTVLAPLNYLPSGGPDGSAYGSASISLATALAGDQPLVFRGQSNFNSSNNAFVGNWLASGVTELTFSLRHNGPAPVTFYTRFAPAGGPGVVALMPTTALPNEWTTFTLPILPTTPFIYEGTTFTSAFSNVARVQFGLIVGSDLAGLATPLTLDIDNVGIVPAPGAAALLGALGLAGLRRRRS